MDLLRRHARGLLAVVLVALTTIAQAGTYVENPPPVPAGVAYSTANALQNGYGNTPENIQYRCHNASIIPAGDIDYSCRFYGTNNSYVYVYACSSTKQRIFLNGSTRVCVAEADIPTPECTIPAGTTQTLNFGQFPPARICITNCWHDNMGCGENGCVAVGTSSGWYKPRIYQSDGTYCDETSQAPEDSTFDDYKDEENCYISASQDKFCESPNSDPCPNYVVIEGVKHCQAPGEYDHANDTDEDGIPDDEDPDPLNPDRDGDGEPDGTDGAPDNPDFDGDGIPDGEDPDDDNDGIPDFVDYNGNNPDTDGDGIPDGEDTDANGNGILDNKEEETKAQDKATEGTCEPGVKIQEPTCTSEADPVQCVLYLNEWHRRCDEIKQYDDLIGSDEYRNSDSLTDDRATNQIGEGAIEVSSAINLDDSGNGFGGSSACPADISVSIGPFGTISFPMTFICDWAEKIRPLVIALGWLAAGMIVFRNMTGSDNG